MLVTGQAEKSFLVSGFSNWKDAKHESSDFHKHCVEALSSVDVGEMLDQQAASDREQNREYLLRLLSSVRYLARQGL